MTGDGRIGPGSLHCAARLLRLRDVWDKIVHLAGCAVLVWEDGGRMGASISGLALFTAGISLLLVGGYALNDAADFHQDRKKEEAPGAIVPPRRHSLVAGVACLTFGTALVLAVAKGPPARLLTCGAVFLGVAYSVPPIRFKERGIWGVLVGAAIQRPALFLVWALTLGTHEPLTIILSLWLFFIGTIGILGHQLLDRDRDRAGSVRTYVFRKGSGAAVVLGMAAFAAAGAAALSPLAFLPPERAWPAVAVLASLTALTAAKSLRRGVRSRLFNF